MNKTFLNYVAIAVAVASFPVALASRTWAAPPPGLEVVAEFDLENPPGNVAVTPDGRIFMSLHGFYPRNYRVVEVLDDGTTRPFPNEQWASAPGDNGIGLNSVLGLRADANGVLWLLDNAGEGQGAKIVAWDTVRDELHRVIYIDQPFLPDNAFLNDLAVDLVHGAIYIADTTGVIDGRPNAALLVIDIESGQVRRVLEGHVSNLAEDVEVQPDGRIRTINGIPVRVGSDSITIAPDHQWLYYGPLSGTKLYRVRTRDLLDTTLTNEELGARVELFSDKPVSDGLTADSGGNIYVTDVNASAIGVINAAGDYALLHQDEQYLSWPDGFAFGPDNKVYVTVNQLHRSPPLQGDGPAATPPFYLLRFDAIAPGPTGR